MRNWHSPPKYIYADDRSKLLLIFRQLPDMLCFKEHLFVGKNDDNRCRGFTMRPAWYVPGMKMSGKCHNDHNAPKTIDSQNQFI